jgi:nitrite reductase/ring-hydroxylating ferredoxin subunit
MAKFLCRANAIAEGEAKGFVLGEGASRIAVFVLRHEGSIRGYVNACPHQGTPLEIFPDRFFDAPGLHLICRTHGALFRPEDGFCVAGPCAGKSLDPVPVRVMDGAVWLDDRESGN